VSVVNETSIGSVVGLPLVGTPPLAHKYYGAATSAGPTRYVRSARLVLLMLSAALALPLCAHDNYTSWVEAVVHPDRLEVTLTLARTAALRLLPDANTLPPITPKSFPDYASRLKAAAPNLIDIRRDDAVLTLSSREVTISGDADITYRLTYPRPKAGTLRFAANYLFQLVDGHVGTIVVSDSSRKDLGWSPVTVDEPNFELKLPQDGTAK
jgi:hypothetical protein